MKKMTVKNGITGKMFDVGFGNKSENWIRGSDIIGFETCNYMDANERSPSDHFFVRVSFQIGRGINGFTNLIEVDEKTHADLKREFFGDFNE